MGGVGSGGNRMGNGIDTTPEDGLPECRPDAPQDVIDAFNYYRERVAPSNLRLADAALLEQLATLSVLADKLQQVINDDPLDHKASGVYLRVAAQMTRLSGLFGLSPGDRKRLSMKTDEEKDDLSEFFKGGDG